MTKLILAAVAVAAFGMTTSTGAANLTSTIGWGCHICGFKNGTQLTGIAGEDASARAISAVILPAGEIVGLR
jgi:hypothetical protein